MSNAFARLKLASKLLLGFGFVVALTTLITVMAYQGLSEMAATTNNLYYKDLLGVSTLRQMNRDINIIGRNVNEVVLSIETDKDADDTARVRIHIDDQGIGMTTEQLSRVCERFYRADASGKVAGTGLGMSIAKEIIELHQGELSISSTPGEGTRVSMTLPC